MPVTAIEAIPYALPFKQPYVTARGTLYRREMILARVHTSEGLIGLGEAVPLSLRGGDPLSVVHEELMRLDAWIRRHTPAAEDAHASVMGELLAQSSAPTRCAVMTAWIDLAGKGNGLPAWRVMGGSGPVPVRCNATITAEEPLQMAEQALAWAEDGFWTFKLKVGTAEDVAAVLTVREAVGAGARIRVDANGAWSADEASVRLTAMAGPDGSELELAEQPCSSLEEMAAVRGRVHVPLAADESVETPKDASRAARLGACSLATIKLSKVGGPTEVANFGSDLELYLSSALDGPVGIAAAAHAVQTLGRGTRDAGVAHGLATQRLFASTIAARECELRGDQLHLPEGPGLGVEIDDAALEAHRL
jgi:muconate cycloisomerase